MKIKLIFYYSRVFVTWERTSQNIANPLKPALIVFPLDYISDIKCFDLYTVIGDRGFNMIRIVESHFVNTNCRALVTHFENKYTVLVSKKPEIFRTLNVNKTFSKLSLSKLHDELSIPTANDRRVILALFDNTYKHTIVELFKS